jgi:hypothetical protein
MRAGTTPHVLTNVRISADVCFENSRLCDWRLVSDDYSLAIVARRNASNPASLRSNGPTSARLIHTPLNHAVFFGHSILRTQEPIPGAVPVLVCSESRVIGFGAVSQLGNSIPTAHPFHYLQPHLSSVRSTILLGRCFNDGRRRVPC